MNSTKSSPTKSSPTSVTDAKVLKLADTTVQNFFNKPYSAPSSPAAVAVAATHKLSPSCWRCNNITPKQKAQNKSKKKLALRQQINYRDRMSRKQLMRKKITPSRTPASTYTNTMDKPYPKNSGGRKTKRRRKHKLRTRKKRKSRRKSRKKHRKKQKVIRDFWAWVSRRP